MTALRVGIVGTGEMGRPLVDRLLAAGHVVTGFARRPEVREDLAAAGVTVVDSTEAMAVGQDVVVVYLYSDEQVVRLGPGIVDAMDRGSLLVVSTTGSPRSAAALAERARARGVGFVDAPGSGGPAQVADGTLSVFVGGTDDDVARARTFFDAYAANVGHFGPAGSGQKVKLLNNLLFGAHVELAAEAGRLCAAMGLSEAEVLRTLHGCSGASAAIDMASATGSTEELVALAARFVHKDVELSRGLADDLGIDLGSLGPVADRVLERTERPAPPVPAPTEEAP